MPPSVSVVIPTFNREELLLRALKSALVQTYRDYEVIVVDDGSTDDTRHELGPYMDRIRYCYQDNQGASAAQNTGIKLARGEWISILASDDEWLPTKLERQFEALSAFGDGVNACFTDCSFTGNANMRQTAFELGGLRRTSLFGILDNPVQYVIARNPVIWAQSLLVRRSLVNDVGGFDEAMVVGEDADLMFRLALRTKFCFVSEALVKVDRTPTRAVGLIELFYSGDERGFSTRGYMYQKWLGFRELVDPRVRNYIEGRLLRGLYYDWMIHQLYELKFRAALEKAMQLRQIGDSTLQIISRVAWRAVRRLHLPVRMYRARSSQSI